MTVRSAWLIALLVFFAASETARAEIEVIAPGNPSQQSVSEPPVPLGRLGTAVVPQRYLLDLTVDPSAERFSGLVEIDVDISEPTRLIDLHGHGLTMRRAAIRRDGEETEGSWAQVHSSGVARIRFDEEIAAGPATLVFDYSAPFGDGPTGMFRVEIDGEWYSWTQFQSIDARAAFPSFDQPGFKTPFVVTLRTPPGLMAISNAPERPVALEDGVAVHRFEPTPPLPTYLVAMMVGPFASLDGTVSPTMQRRAPLPLRIVTTRSNAGKLDFPLEGSQQIVRYLEHYFSEPFPFPKLDQITSPVMPGAMENAGANLYRDDLLVMDAGASIDQQRGFGRVVSHEIAHQWFGDLVTPEWWDDIWLNESFANWMGYRIGEAWRPDLNFRGGALAEGIEAMAIDSLVVGRPIRQPIETSARIDAAFDRITYGKGGHVIGMFAEFIGDEAFRDGVQRYLAAHRYGSATSADFFAALAQAAGDARIVSAMRSFIEQQGVPLLIFRREHDQFTVSQLRYAPLGTEVRSPLWDVPMCVRRGANRLCKLLTGRTTTFELKGYGPLIPNAGGAGYYRFDLPERHWKELIATAGRLPGGEAQAVVDSLSASVLAGRGNVDELARLARKLIRHPDSYAADAAVDAMGRLASTGIVDQDGRRGWRLFRSRLYAPLFKEYGFDPRAGAYAAEPPERTQRRKQIVDKFLGTVRAGKLRRQLSEATEAYLAGDAEALDPTWFASGLDLHLYLGGEPAAKALMERALASEDPLFRPAAIDSLGRTGMEAIARWILEDFKDERLRMGEQRALLEGIMMRGSTRQLGYDWIVRNLDALLADRRGIFFAARLPQLLVWACSASQAEMMASDLRRHFADTPGELELERAIERVRNCGVLKDALGTEISEGFARLR